MTADPAAAAIAQSASEVGAPPGTATDEHLDHDEGERPQPTGPGQRPQRGDDAARRRRTARSRARGRPPRAAARGRRRARWRRIARRQVRLRITGHPPAGPRERREAWRSTVSSDPGPRQAMTGTPASAQRRASRSRSSSRSRQTSRASRASSTPVTDISASSLASSPRSSGGRVSTTTTAWPLRASRTAWASGSAETRADSSTTKAPGGMLRRSWARSARSSPTVPRLGSARPRPSSSRAQLAVAADGGDLDHAGTAEHRQADPVAGGEVVRRHRAGGLDGHVEARAAAERARRARRGRGWRRRRGAPRHPGRRRSWSRAGSRCAATPASGCGAAGRRCGTAAPRRARCPRRPAVLRCWPTRPTGWGSAARE